MVGLSIIVILGIFVIAWLRHGGVHYLKQKIRNEKQ